jgi:hypothetical protein
MKASQMCSEAFFSRSTSNGHVFLQETKKTWAHVGVVVIDHEEERVADELTKVIKSSKNRRLIKTLIYLYLGSKRYI